MRKIICLGIFVLQLFFAKSWALTTPDWTSEARILNGENRTNIFNLTLPELKKNIRKGRIHALYYPVSITGLLIPYRPFVNFLESNPNNPLKKFFLAITKKQMGFNTIDGLYKWLGLSSYPERESENVFDPYFVPYPNSNGKKPKEAMGATIMTAQNGALGLTFSCTACHSANLFGRPVIGMANKRARANQFFVMGQKYTPMVLPELMKISSKATDSEVQLFKRTQYNIKAVEASSPQVLGLDTSLSITALSLTHRADDEYASRSSQYEKKPRENEFRHFIADSKPMPWWNTKYKTRWLSDGSMISGNPIFTNFLWNELGRGTDLHLLEKWMDENEKTVEELTAAVFASQAPRWVDYFGVKSINIANAKSGEVLFKNNCQKCHGTYEKGWSGTNSAALNLEDQLATTKVIYHEKTPVMNVGTDLSRAEGMKYFAENLNQLAISKKMGTVIVPQSGYVPPPLVGIWARYPYLHNASVPTLCAILSPQEFRPKSFYLGPSDNALTDFDHECVGYPIGNYAPRSWRVAENFLDTTKAGLSNGGHEKMLYDNQGHEKFSVLDKKMLIEFLKTL